VPFIGRNRAVVTGLGPYLRSEPMAPRSDAFLRSYHAPLGQQILDIAQAQGKPMIRPNGIGDDVPTEPESFSRGCETLLTMKDGYTRVNNLTKPCHQL
jgi:hypothetical protein